RAAPRCAHTVRRRCGASPPPRSPRARTRRSSPPALPRPQTVFDPPPGPALYSSYGPWAPLLSWFQPPLFGADPWPVCNLQKLSYTTPLEIFSLLSCNHPRPETLTLEQRPGLVAFLIETLIRCGESFFPWGWPLDEA